MLTQFRVKYIKGNIALGKEFEKKKHLTKKLGFPILVYIMDQYPQMEPFQF